MDIFFCSLGLIGYFSFLIWIISASITKKQKKTPTIGLILSAVIIVTFASIYTSNVTEVKSNSEYKKVVAAVTSPNVQNDKNVVADDSIVDINRDELSNHKISKNKGLEIVTLKVKIEPGLHILYDSERNIKGKSYYLYTINNEEYTFEDYSYCVDVDSGELFKCSNDMTLLKVQ